MGVGPQSGSLVAATVVAVLASSCIAPSGQRGEPGEIREQAGQQLLSLIPGEVKPCAEEYEDFIGGGTFVAIAGHPDAIAGVFCSWDPPSAPENEAGSVSLTYLLFPSRAAMYGDYWDRWVFDGRLGKDCVTERWSEFVYHEGGEEAGRVFCTGGDFQPEITWTDDQTLVLANAMLIPFPDIGARQLYEWWVGRLPGEVVLQVGAAREQCLGKTANVVGTTGDDVLRGSPGADVIVGLGGEDVIRGLGAKDRICGGAGDDRLIGGDGNDVMSGGSGEDWLAGGGQLFDRVSFIDASGPVRVDLAAGIALGEGTDSLNGIPNAQGSRFDDVLIGDDDLNDLYGEGGNDVLDGRGDWDWLHGGVGDDRLEGGTGRNWLYGDDGDDVLEGGPDPDRLFGGLGIDTCIRGEWLKECEGQIRRVPDHDRAAEVKHGED